VRARLLKKVSCNVMLKLTWYYNRTKQNREMVKMKKVLRQAITVAACSACLLLPISVGANVNVLNKKGLYEMRTLTGQFQPGFNDGTSKTGSLYQPSSLIQLSDGSIVISDTDNHRLRLLKDDTLTSYSGQVLDFDTQGLPVGAYNDGNRDSAFYNEPAGITQDAAGNIYVADSSNHSIRKLTPDGNVVTLAGNGLPGYQDGTKQSARFYLPSDVAVDHQGNVYVTDTLNHLIRKVDANGNVTTLNKPSSRIVEFYPGLVEDSGDFKDGPLAEAMFNEPTGLAIDDKGNLFVSDTGNQRIRYIDFTNGTVSTVAGGGDYSSNALYVEGQYIDGAAADARFSNPAGLTVARDGSLLVADRSNQVIRLITNNEVHTLVGQGTEYGKADGILAAAYLNDPSDVIELSDGSLAIADSSNNKIRIVQRYQSPEHQEDGNIHVIIDGALLATDVAPQLRNGRTYVPLRALADKLGYEISYDRSNGQVSLVIHDQLSYVFSEGGAAVVKQSAEGEQTLDEKSFIYDNRLVVPVRFVTEQLQYDVQWDGENKHVVVRTPIFSE
jgi:sugar lactone lactonase YvrE